MDSANSFQDLIHIKNSYPIFTLLLQFYIASYIPDFGMFSTPGQIENLRKEVQNLVKNMAIKNLDKEARGIFAKYSFIDPTSSRDTIEHAVTNTYFNRLSQTYGAIKNENLRTNDNEVHLNKFLLGFTAKWNGQNNNSDSILWPIINKYVVKIWSNKGIPINLNARVNLKANNCLTQHDIDRKLTHYFG